MNPVWWRRNRPWLIALIPALLVALAASAFRMTTLYLPWEWSKPTVADGPTATLTQDFLAFDDNHYTRTVEVTVLSVEKTRSVGEHAPVDGAVMWRIDLQFTAEPDQVLRGACTIELVDGDGVRYNVLAGKQAADPDAFYPKLVVPPECVPKDAPGPDFALVSGETIESPVERPRTWTHSASVVTPAGVTPERVRIGWAQPEYLDLRIP